MILFLELLTIFLCVIFIAIIVIHKRFLRKYDGFLKKFPGPEPNPFFGNMLDFLVPTHQFLNVISNYFDKYGNVIRIIDGPASCMIIVKDEKLLEYILSSTKLIEKSMQYQHFHNWLETGLLTSSGPKWKSRRRMITPAFHFSILEHYVEIFEKVGDIFIRKLRAHVGEKSFDVYPLVSLCALDVICEAAMGISVNAQINGNSKYVRNVKKLCKICTDRNFSALGTKLYPLTPNFYRERFALRVLHKHTDDVINRRIKELEGSDKEEKINDFGMKKKVAFLDVLLKSTCDGAHLSRRDIREEVDTFMFEGHDTTSSAISFALYTLANHPSVQEKALDEQRGLFEDLKNAKCTISDLQNMKYLELVIKETLRLYPSVPLFGRQTLEEFEYDGIIFPKGMQIQLSPFFAQRDPKYYPKPLEFIPERFKDIDGSNPFRYIPFSAGPRNCIGQKFAMLEIKSTISKVLRNFELLPAVPDVELQLAPELILISKNGINVSLRNREK